jgi:hypothetical protein
MQPNQLDPQALNLAKAIRRAETGGSADPYNTKGASGEFGAYQFMPDTWKQWSGKYLGNPNSDFSIENQNKVAYSRIKELKDQGYNPAQIASMWNSGSPTAYQEGKKGVNKMGVQYDVPGYVQKVSQHYNEIKMGGQAAPVGNTQFTNPNQPPQPQSGGFLSQLNTLPMEAPKPPSQLDYRLDQAGDALGTLSQGVVNKNPLQIGSGLLQTGGAAAGGFLDATDAAIKAIPVVGDVVEGAEKVIGGVAGKALDTELGQAAVEKYQSLPESWRKNIGAAGNIAAAVPVLRGLKMAAGGIKNKVGDAISGAPEAVAKKELEGVVNRLRTGGERLRVSTKRGMDPIGLIVREAPPSIIKDAKGVERYNIADSYNNLETTIAKLDDQLDTVLEEATRKVPGYKGFWDLEDVKEDVLREIKKEYRGSPELKSALKKVDDDFESISESFGGGRISLGDLNLAKRKIRKSVNFDSPQLDRDVRYHAGQAIMRAVETLAEQRGMKNVKELNRQMSERLEAQEILTKYLSNKSVTNTPGIQGFISRQGEVAATAAGEAVGQSFGMPVLGGVLGRGALNKAVQGRPSALERLRQRRKPTSRKDYLVPPAALLANQSAQQESQRRQQQ